MVETAQRELLEVVLALRLPGASRAAAPPAATAHQDADDRDHH